MFNVFSRELQEFSSALFLFFSFFLFFFLFFCFSLRVRVVSKFTNREKISLNNSTCGAQWNSGLTSTFAVKQRSFLRNEVPSKRRLKSLISGRFFLGTVNPGFWIRWWIYCPSGGYIDLSPEETNPRCVGIDPFDTYAVSSGISIQAPPRIYYCVRG